MKLVAAGRMVVAAVLALALGLPMPPVSAHAAVDSSVCAVLYLSGDFVVQRGADPDPALGFVLDTWEGLDDTRYTDKHLPPWREVGNWLKRVVFKDGVAPSSTAHWFDAFHYASPTWPDYPFTSVDLSGLNASRLKDASWMFAGTKLKAVDLGRFSSPVLRTTKNMFYCDYDLRTVKASGFKAPKLTSSKGMFYGCNFKKLDLRGFPASSLEDVSSMLWNCDELRVLDVRGWDTRRLKTTARMMLGCKKLEKVKGISKWETPKLKSCARMFEGCGKMKRIKFGSWSSGRLKTARAMFAKCRALASITLGKRFSKLPRGMFAGLRGRATVTVRSKRLASGRVAGCMRGWERIESADPDETYIWYRPAKVRRVRVQVGGRAANARWACRYRPLFSKAVVGKHVKVVAAKR